LVARKVRRRFGQEAANEMLVPEISRAFSVSIRLVGKSFAWAPSLLPLMMHDRERKASAEHAAKPTCRMQDGSSSRNDRSVENVDCRSEPTRVLLNGHEDVTLISSSPR
jgi:hypothetical protein